MDRIELLQEPPIILSDHYECLIWGAISSWCDFKLGLLNKAHQDYISPPYLIRDGLFILIAFKISQ